MRQVYFLTVSLSLCICVSVSVSLSFSLSLSLSLSVSRYLAASLPFRSLAPSLTLTLSLPRGKVDRDKGFDAACGADRVDEHADWLAERRRGWRLSCAGDPAG